MVLGSSQTDLRVAGYARGMNRLLSLVFMFVLTGLMVQVAAAPNLSRFDDWLFQMPTGWRTVPSPSDLSLVSPDGKAVIVLFRSEPISGNLRSWFDQRLAQLHNGFTVTQIGQVTSTPANEGYTAWASTVSVKDAKGNLRFEYFFGADPGSRGELLLYRANDAASFTKYQKVLEAFFLGADFAQLKPDLAAKAMLIGSPNAAGSSAGSSSTGGSSTTSPNTTSPNAASSSGTPAWVTAPGKGLRRDQLDGVYLQLHTAFGVGGLMIQVYTPYLFLKDGWVYTRPVVAVSDFDASTSKRLEPDRWGRWQRTGGSVLIRWNKEPNKTHTFKQKEFIPALPAKPGLKLEGHYESISGSGNTMQGGGTTIISGRDLYFSGDGRFSSEAATGGSSSGAGGTVTFESNGGVSAGVYSFDGFTVQFKYDDGSVRRWFYCEFPPDAGVQHEVVIVGGRTYIKN
jgi:hypothetical protein